MSLNSDQLDAFFEVARTGSFSKAASGLGVSQPALSQRVKKLEDQLQSALFVRETSGAILTELGRRLLLYCRNRRDLETEFLRSPSSQEVHGIVRIAGFSSVMRSTVAPALSELVDLNPRLQLELSVHELRDLPALLKSSEVDFVLTEKPISSSSVENIYLGFEENVLIESTRKPSGGEQRYFDHDTEDQCTFEFFKKQPKRTTAFRAVEIQRSFLDEIYMIIDAVERGWGRAVVQRHLIRDNKRVRILDELTAVKTDVYLSFHSQAFYLPLHKKLTAILTKNVPRLLKNEE